VDLELSEVVALAMFTSPVYIGREEVMAETVARVDVRKTVDGTPNVLSLLLIEKSPRKTKLNICP